MFLDNDGRSVAPPLVLPHPPAPNPPRPAPPPPASQVAPLKNAIYKSLQDGKSLKTAMQAAQHAQPKVDQQALIQAALLAQEEWRAAQAAAKAAAQKAAPKAAPPKPPPKPLVQATTAVANTGLIAPAALARASAALQHPSAPVAPAKPPLAAPTSAQVQVYIGAIGQHRQEGMTLAQAVNAARIDQGGGAADEQALAEAALAVQGSTHLAGIAQGQDPITAAEQDLTALKAFQPATLKAAGAAMVAPKAGPDRGVAPAVAAQQKLQADTKARASAATLAADRAALHQALGNQLVGLYGGSDDTFLADATQVDKLWQGEYTTMRDDVLALFRAQDHGGSAAGPSAQSVDDQAQSLFTSIQAGVIMRQVSDAQGGRNGTDYAKAAQTLSADLQGAGATPGSALANQIIGGDPSHPADAAVAALTQNAIAQVAGRGTPLVCTATDDGDPTHKLAALSNALMPYEGTVIDAPLISGVTHNASTQTLFTMLAPASLMQQADAHTKLAQVASVLDAAKTSPALANALYEEKFRGAGVDSRQGGVLYWAAHATSDVHQTEYYTNLGRIYNDLGGAGSADAVALRGVIAARMGQSGNAVATGMNVTTVSRGDYLSGHGYTAPTPQFGLGDVRNAGANLQLYQDILDTQPNSQTGKEIAKETQYTAGGAQAWANTAQARSGAALDTLAPGGGLQAATSHAQLVDALGQAFNLTPRTPHSNADWQAQQQGTFIAYDEQQKVYGNTTLGDIADATQRGAGVAHISDTTPVVFSALPLNYWTHDQDPQKDAPQQLSLIDLQNAGGQQSYVGPADTTVRASYSDWQSNNGFDKGQMMVLPGLLSGPKGQPLTGNGYWLQHQTGTDHWYDWDHIKTDLEVVGTVAAAALATFVAPEGAPLWLGLLADAADAYLTYQAVSGTAQAVQAMTTQGPDGSYGYQHWQTYLQLGANAFGALAGAGGLGARSAALLGRAGTAGRVAGVAARGAKVSDGVAQVLVRKSILLPAVGLNLAANATSGWQIADALVHGQDVSASQKLQFALSAALTALPFAVRGRIGTTPARVTATGSAAPKTSAVSAAPTPPVQGSAPVATLVLADGSSVELDAPAHDYAGTGPQFKLEPHGSKLSHAAHRVGSALILPAGLLFHTVAGATGWHNGVLDLLSERSWPSLGGKMRSVVSKAMSITLKTGLQRALDAAQRGDTAEVERQMSRLLAHRSRLGLPEFAGHVLPILADSLQDAAQARRALARTADASAADPSDPDTARFVAQAQARYDHALASFKENRAKVGKTAFATTAYGRAMRRTSMLLAAIGAGDALADPTLLPAQKILYLASGLVSTGTQWFYMHAMLDYARNPNDATLAKLAKASQWNDRVYAANALIDASLGGINEGRGAVLSGLLSFSQAAGEGTFYLATRHLPSRKQIIAAGAGLFLMVGSAAASHLKAGSKGTPADAAQPPLPAAALTPWQLEQAMAELEEAPIGLASMAPGSPWRLPYVEVSARGAASRTLWGIAQSHRSELDRAAAQAGSQAGTPVPDTDNRPLLQLAELNPQFDWSLDAPGLTPARTPRGQNPNLIFPGQVVWVG